MRIELGFLDILDGDQANAAAFAVDHDQLFDAVAVQQPLGFRLVDAFLDRDQIFMGHQLADLLIRIGCETDIAVGENADQVPRFAGPAAMLDNRNA